MAYPNFYRSRYADPDAEIDPNEPAQYQTSLSALLPKSNPDLDARWLDAENRALSRNAQGGTDYGVAEGVRDFAPMAVGSMLDILVNKGQGLGTLAAGGMQALSSEQSRRDAAQKDAARQALAIKQQRDSGADRTTNAYHAMLRGEELRNRIDEDLAKRGTPDEQKAARSAGLEHTQAETRNITAEAVEREKYPGSKTLLDMYRYGTAAQQHAAELELKKRELEYKQTELKDKADTRARELQDKADVKAQTTSTANRQTYNKRTEKIQSEARNVREINNILRKHPGDVPGSGPADSRVPNWMTSDDGLRLKGLKAGLLTSEILEFTGKASREKEDLRIQAIHGLGPNATDREFRLGMDAFTKLTRERLSGWRSGMESDADAVLTEGGLYDFVYPDGPPGQAGAPSGGQPPPSAAPPPGRAITPPSAASSSQPDPASERPKATPEEVKQFRQMMNQIPKGERDAVIGGIDTSLPMKEQLKMLSEELARRLVKRGPDPADSAGTPSGVDMDMTNDPEAVRGSPAPKAVDKAKQRGWIR